MKLARVVEVLDDVQEQYRSLYEEKDGKFHLTLEVDPTDEDRKRVADAAEKVRIARDSAEKRAREAEEALKKFDGIDLEEVRQLREAAEARETEEAKQKGEFQKLYESSEAARKAEVTKIKAEADEKIASLEKEIADLIADVNLASGMDAAKIHPSLRAGARALLHPRIKAQKDNGTRRAIVEFDGRAVPVVDFVKLWSQSEEGQPYTQAPDNVGGGAAGSGRGAGLKEPNPWKKDTLNLTRQGQILRDNPDLAQRLKAEAGRRV